MPRYNPIDKSWVVNVLTHGDLEGTLRPNAVRINRYLEGPNEDGSFASLVDDGKVYISALFLASGVKYFEHRYAEVAQSPPDIFKTRVCLQKYKVIHKLHENLNLCEFWLEVEQFVDWNPDDAFFHKGCLNDCMAVQEVRERSHQLWQESLASQANSSVPFTQVMCRLGREDILSQAEGTDPDLKAYFVNSFWTEPFHIEDFLISDEDKKQLSLIEEWQDDYKPPVTPSVSLASGSSSIQERGNMDEGKEGSPPSQQESAPRQEGSTPRQEGSTPRQEGNTPRQEGNTPRQEQSTGEDSNSVSASGVEVAGRDSVPLIQTSPQQEVTSSSSIDEPSIVTATAGRPPSDVGNDTRDSVNISDVCVGRFRSVSVQVHASQDISQPLVSDRRMVHAGVQVGGLTGEDRQGSRTDDDSMELQDAQVILSRDGSSDDGFHAPYLPKAHAGGNKRPSNMTLCPLVDGSLDVMLGCTDHSRESEHSRRSDRSRGSDHMDKDCSNSRDVVSTGAAMRNSSTKSHSTGCSDVRRLSRVRGAGVAVCSTQVNWCPLEQLPCLDVSAVDQSVTDSMCSVAPVTDTRTHGLRLYPADDDILAPRAECDILCVDWNGDVGRVRDEAKVHSKVQDATKLDDVDNKKQRGHQQIGNETVDTMTERHNRNRSEEISEQQEEQRLVDTMTERHDRNSSEEILLSEQQEEQRLVDTMTERHDRNSSEEILLSEQQEEQRLVDTMTERHDRNSSEEILLSEQQEEQRLVDTMTERHDRNSSEEILLSEQQEEQRLVDTMTERHDRNSSEEILLSEQQEEQRLVDITKTSTVVSDPLDEPMTEPDSPRHLSPVLISLAPPVLQSTRVTSDREPVICIPLSGSETFTQMPRQKRHESGSRWDVGVLYEPKHQRKHRRARKLYTEAVLLPTEDPPIPADWADDNSLSRKDKSCLTDRNEATSCSQPDNCMIISSSSEHCTPASPVDDIARSSGNTISSTNNDSVESSELDGAAVQRLELLLSVEVTPIQQKLLELDFTEKDPSLVGFTTTYFMQQKFDYNT